MLTDRFIGGPVPRLAIDHGVCEPLFRACERAREVVGHCGTAYRSRRTADDTRLARQRRVFADHDVDERVETRMAFGGADAAGAMLVHRVDADAGFTPRDAEQALVVHQLEQVRGGARRAAPVVRDLPCAKCASTSRGCTSPRVAHELEHRLGALVRRRRQQARAFARVHQRRHAAADETVVDEEVLFDRQRRVEPFEIAGAIARDAMAQREVLRAGRRADRIGLDEAQALDRRGQAG